MSLLSCQFSSSLNVIAGPSELKMQEVIQLLPGIYKLLLCDKFLSLVSLLKSFFLFGIWLIEQRHTLVLPFPYVLSHFTKLRHLLVFHLEK